MYSCSFIEIATNDINLRSVFKIGDIDLFGRQFTPLLDRRYRFDKELAMFSFEIKLDQTIFRLF